MKRLIKYCILFIGLALLSCMGGQDNGAQSKAQFDERTNTLTVDFPDNTDTALQQIILFSKVKVSGYGLLLNFNSTLSHESIADIKDRFKKLDINAVHDFNLSSAEEMDAKINVAIEGAKFTWVFSNDRNWAQQPEFHEVKQAIIASTRSGGVLVIH